MKVGPSSFLAWALAALPLIQSAAGEPLAPQDVQPHLKALSTVQKFQQAIPQNPCPTEPQNSPQSVDQPFSFDSFVKSQNCRELLSPVPPAWISTAPQAGIFKNLENWQPVCSTYWLEKLARKSTPVDRAAALPLLESETLQLDSCVNSANDRYGGSFKEPSQESSHLQPMGAEARVKLSESFEWEKYRLSKLCCGSDDTCTILVRSVSLRFCKPQSNPKAPDPYVVNGTYHFMGDWENKSRWLYNIKHGATLSELKASFPVAPGEITVSPFENTQTHQPYYGASLATLRHELGHACSQIKRELLISQGSSEALHDLAAFKDCSLDIDRSNLYKNLSDSLGINQETSLCLETNARGAKNARFIKEGSCKKGCEVSYLEESLANVLQIVQTDPSEIASKLFPLLCEMTKDSRHGLNSDSLRCALNTPSLKAKIEEGLACTK